jgi:trans-aconitate methyltransferase
VLKDPGDAFSVGCGSGLFEEILDKEFGISIKNGIEPAEAMAVIARSRGMNVGITTAEEMEIGEENYDTILFNGTPSYIKDLQKAFDKSYAALRPGGEIVVVDVPKESSYGLLYSLASTLGSWDDQLLQGVKPAAPYPIEFAKAAKWRTTPEKIRMLEKTGFVEMGFAQTLTRHPVYSDNEPEEPVVGYNRGDYVAIYAFK